MTSKNTLMWEVNIWYLIYLENKSLTVMNVTITQLYLKIINSILTYAFNIGKRNGVTIKLFIFYEYDIEYTTIGTVLFLHRHT
jgi:hypothetical protein